MAITDVIQYEGSKDRQWLLYKYPKIDILIGTTLVVRKGQEAVVLKDGIIDQIYDEGTYTLITGNIPKIKKAIDKIYGESPFIAEVYFINKISKLDMNWGTGCKIEVDDPIHHMFLHLKSYASYSVKIADSRKFLSCLIGGIPKGSLHDFSIISEFTRPKMDQILTATIARFIYENKISSFQAKVYLEDLSLLAGNKLQNEFTKYGMDMFDFVLRNIDVEDTDYLLFKKRREELSLGPDVYEQMKENELKEQQFGMQYGRVEPHREQVISYHCPNCGAPINKNAELCPFCQCEVIIKDLNSVFALNEAKLKKYTASYQKENNSSPELYKAKGLCYLRLHSFDFAIHSFNKAIEENYEDGDLYFYIALSLCRGKRPFLLTKKEIDKIISNLEIALKLNQKGSYYYLYSLVIRDFYEKKRFNYKISSLEYDKLASSYGMSQEDKKIIHKLLPVSEFQH